MGGKFFAANPGASILLTPLFIIPARAVVHRNTTDNIRKLTYNFLIFPLELRFRAGERSRSLYESIMALARDLMKDVAL